MVAASLIGGAAFVGEREAEAQTAPAKKNGRIFFVSDRVTPGNPEGDRETFSVNPDGSGLRQLTDNRYRESSPVASPDGKMIAYARFDGSGSEIYSVPTTGGMPTRLGRGRSPVFSPDSKTIAYVGHDGSDSEVYTVPAAGGTTKQLTRDARDSDAPDFSPDGKTVVYQGAVGQDGFASVYDLFTIPAAGGTPRQLTRNRDDDVCPTFSSDGKKVVFLSGTNHRGLGDDIFIAYGVWEKPAAGGPATRLGETYAHMGCPVFSPDGTEIAFSSLGHPYQGRLGSNNGRDEIYVMNRDGSGSGSLPTVSSTTRPPSSPPTGRRSLTGTTATSTPFRPLGGRRPRWPSG